MTTSGMTADAGNTSRGNRLLALVFGLLSLVPALVWAALTLIQPTLQTLQFSQQNANPIRPQSAQFVGFDNYTHIFNDPLFGRGLSFTLTLMVVRVLAIAVAPFLLAVLVNEFGRGLRI